jgi:phosphatidylethanolamine/phosphatidyl-N-methylethanolamine N-methyltransferase
LLPDNIEITGIDLSQKMLERAHKRVEAQHMDHVTLQKMDATNLEFPDDSFDRVLAAYFISTVPDPVRCVEEMKRVCKPGGYIVFLNHFKSFNKFIGIFDEMLSPLCYRIGFKMNLDLHKLMADTGLEIERLERIDFRGQWKAVRCVNP